MTKVLINLGSKKLCDLVFKKQVKGFGIMLSKLRKNSFNKKFKNFFVYKKALMPRFITSL